MNKKAKTLDDIKIDMSRLYDEVNNGTTELKTAAELANIAGKYLKAEQLQLAREIFASSLSRRVRDLSATDAERLAIEA